MHLHFIGIGGIGMSALARLHRERGDEVTGSDSTDSPLLGKLRDEGIGIFLGHSASQVAPDVEVVIYSEAISTNNAELVAAEERGISKKTYFEALGEWTRDKKTICIAGTHGKTTTTAMIAKILLESYRDPSVVIGSQMSELEGKNMHLGGGEWMVVEACEYRRSFIHLHPEIVVLTNIELDHVDYYKDVDDYRRAFEEFVRKIPENGMLIANGDDENIRMVAQSAQCTVHFFNPTEKIPRLQLNVPGKHNRANAMAAYTLAKALNIEEEMILESLNAFEGTWRRFEHKGTYNGAEIYDDYAHHPTEIRATLQAAREQYPDQRIVAVFQPHQYSRAKRFLSEFGTAFQDADEVIVPNIYFVRDNEADRESLSTEQFAQEIQRHHANVQDGKGLESTVDYLRKTLQQGDVALIMGAGDVWKISEGLLN